MRYVHAFCRQSRARGIKNPTFLISADVAYGRRGTETLTGVPRSSGRSQRPRSNPCQHCRSRSRLGCRTFSPPSFWPSSAEKWSQNEQNLISGASLSPVTRHALLILAIANLSPLALATVHVHILFVFKGLSLRNFVAIEELILRRWRSDFVLLSTGCCNRILLPSTPSSVSRTILLKHSVREVPSPDLPQRPLLFGRLVQYNKWEVNAR